VQHEDRVPDAENADRPVTASDLGGTYEEDTSGAYDHDVNRSRRPWWEGASLGLLGGVIGMLVTYGLDAAFPGNRVLIGAAALAVGIPFVALMFWHFMWRAR
jgi:hypothetical protein